jgi:hypothetical protein
VRGFGRESESGNEKVVPGSLRGYRHFRMNLVQDERAGKLLSVNHHIPFEPVTEALCNPNGQRKQSPLHDADVPVPAKKCTCGIYGWYNPKDIDNHSSMFLNLDMRITAVIQASGKVILGTTGFRAQRAQVVATVEPLQELLRAEKASKAREIWERYEEMRATYGVQSFKTLPEMQEAFPPEDVSGLLPETPERSILDELFKVQQHAWHASYMQQYMAGVLQGVAPSSKPAPPAMTPYGKRVTSISHLAYCATAGYLDGDYGPVTISSSYYHQSVTAGPRRYRDHVFLDGWPPQVILSLFDRYGQGTYPGLTIHFLRPVDVQTIDTAVWELVQRRIMTHTAHWNEYQDLNSFTYHVEAELI